jgi:hypothetical protein
VWIGGNAPRHESKGVARPEKALSKLALIDFQPLEFEDGDGKGPVTRWANHIEAILRLVEMLRPRSTRGQDHSGATLPLVACYTRL